MKILFSPAETKKSGGVIKKLDCENFIFSDLSRYRKEVLDRYKAYISAASNEELSRFFGIKDSSKFEKYKTNIFQLPLMKVIERYDGVAFDYLNYSSLNDSSRKYIDENVIVFSNLFGPLKAGDFGIPEYKLKQGEKIGNFAPEAFYKKFFSDELDKLLDEPYLDLRAGFYSKFYRPSSEHITLKFLKDGKVVSHWAKAYRGLILKSLAENNIQTIDEFMKMEIKTLSIKEILYKGKNTAIVYVLTI